MTRIELPGRILGLVVSGVLIASSSIKVSAEPSIATHSNTARLYGVHEITLPAGDLGSPNPWTDVEVAVDYTLPDGTKKTVDGFYDGEGRFKSRAYCCQAGRWSWRSRSSLASLDRFARTRACWH